MAPSIGVNLRVTGHSNQGGRKYMEDAFAVAYQQSKDETDLEYAYFGIFDGHGGREAALFAKEHLMDFIINQKHFWSDDDDHVLKAIRDGFIATHMAMWKEIGKWPQTMSGLPSTSGSTASIVFIRKGKLYIGHVGDSALVLGYKDPGDDHFRVQRLTRDHKPESPNERKRIETMGGSVVNKSGVQRVVWNRPHLGHQGPIRRSTRIDQIPFLAVARSLGDLWSYDYFHGEFLVSPEPDVSVVKLSPERDKCIILGSDGLWNMISPLEAVSIAEKADKENEKRILEDMSTGNEKKTWLNPSKLLIDKALEEWCKRKMRADNTSVVTVMLDPPGPPKSEVLVRQHMLKKLRPREEMEQPNYQDSERRESRILVASTPTQVHSSSAAANHAKSETSSQLPSGNKSCYPNARSGLQDFVPSNSENSNKCTHIRILHESHPSSYSKSYRSIRHDECRRFSPHESIFTEEEERVPAQRFKRKLCGLAPAPDCSDGARESHKLKRKDGNGKDKHSEGYCRDPLSSTRTKSTRSPLPNVVACESLKRNKSMFARYSPTCKLYKTVVQNVVPCKEKYRRYSTQIDPVFDGKRNLSDRGQNFQRQKFMAMRKLNHEYSKPSSPNLVLQEKTHFLRRLSSRDVAAASSVDLPENAVKRAQCRPPPQLRQADGAPCFEKLGQKDNAAFIKLCEIENRDCKEKVFAAAPELCSDLNLVGAKMRCRSSSFESEPNSQRLRNRSRSWSGTCRKMKLLRHCARRKAVWSRKES